MSKIDISSLLNEESLTFKGSPLGEISRLAAKAKAIDLAGGLPDPIMLPVAEFAGGALVLGRDGMKILQYGSSQGYAPLRAFLAERTASRESRTVTPDDILITTGSQQAFSLAAAALLTKHDAVVTDEATYPGAEAVIRSRHAVALPAKSDGDGMDPEDAESVIKRAKRDGTTVKMIYTVPNFNNPTGSLMSLERRRALVEAAARNEVVIFEDDPYGDLRYKGDRLPSLAQLDAEMDTGCVVSAGSFSKILAPGTRVGWLTAPKDLLRVFVTLKGTDDISASVIAQALVARYCEDGHLEPVIERFRTQYRKKRDAMAAAIMKHFPKTAEFKVPDGGYFFWVRVPGANTNKVFLEAIENGAAFVPGRVFFADAAADDADEYMRLCFTQTSLGEIDAGCASIGEALAKVRR